MRLFKRTQSVTAASRCGHCGHSIENHPQRDIASAVIASPEHDQAASLVSVREWEAAARHQAANEIADIRVWRAVRCNDGRVGVVSMVIPIEMWADNYYEDVLILTPRDGAELARFVNLD